MIKVNLNDIVYRTIVYQTMYENMMLRAGSLQELNKIVDWVVE